MPRCPCGLTIGNKAGADILIADNRISGICAILSVRSDVSDASFKIALKAIGHNDLIINNNPVTEEDVFCLTDGDVVSICDIRLCVCRYHLFIYGIADLRTSLIEIEPYELRKITRCDLSRRVSFLPTQRNSPVIDYSPIELELPPARRMVEKQSLILAIGPALTMAVPILLGAGRKIMVLAGVIAAVWAGLNVYSRRKRNHKEEVLRRRAYKKYVEDCEEIINERIRNIRNVLYILYPDVNECLRGRGNIYLMWNRTFGENDYGDIRIGIGEMIFPVEIKSPKEKFSVVDDSLRELPKSLREKYKMINDVPICINLFSQGPFAIATTSVNEKVEIISSLILQICISFKPDELKLAVCAEDIVKLPGIRFIPHAWSENISYLDVNGHRKDAIFEDIERKSNQKTVLITDSVDSFNRALTLENCIIIFSDNNIGTIPTGVKTVLEYGREFSGILHMGVDRRRRQSIFFDRIGRGVFHDLSRTISSLHSFVLSSSKPIPDRVLLTEILGEDNLSATSILDMWNKEVSDFSLAVPIGKRENDEIVYLDADEKGCGPHGLIAGTTGSGKSELLQTFVLSLSYRFPPWRASFFLIDYKGGGMANMFEDLPHVAGSVSNLSGAVTERAMVSIKSENTLRQQIFAEYGVNSIHDYQLLFEKGIARVALAHIFIIIDEFAELKKEEPDFMQELISVAQVGRSLGIHLILATQKPAGCVDDKIWSNSRFRICLKVRDRADSVDMLHTADASYITNVGRAYLQVGNDEIYMQFQCAYTMAPVCSGKADIGYTLFDENLERTDVILRSKSDVCMGENSAKSQMVLLKDLIKEAYSRCEKKRIQRLWMDELPKFLMPPSGEIRGCAAAIGVYDDPILRLQDEFYYDISQWGNTMIIGLPGSGKSTFLLRILTCLCYEYSSGNLGIYIIDFGGKKLAPFEGSNLCGGYVSFEEYDRIAQLIIFLKDEFTKRKIKGNSSFVDDANTSLPIILTVIDNFGSVISSVGDEVISDIVEIMRDGASCGMYFLISATMIASGELPSRISVLCNSAISFSQRDKYSYSGIFSVSPGTVPSIDNIPGRGLVRIDTRILQFQSYTPVAAADETKWRNCITDVIKTANKHIKVRCKQFPYVPKDPCFSDFASQCAASKEELSTFSIPIGYEVQSGRIFTIPISEFGICLITGRRKSGRKNTLEIIEKMADLQGIDTFRFSHLKELSTFIKSKNEGIALCNSLISSVDKFYNDDYDKGTEDILWEFFTEVTYEPEKSPLKVIFVMNNKDRNNLMGRRLWNAMAEHPYVIALGGMLSELSFFDFSYVPYTLASKRKPLLCGDVAFYDDDLFYGSIVIPRIEAEDADIANVKN